MAQAKIFNPGALADGAGAQTTSSKPKDAEKKPYETTGTLKRDNVRKMLFDVFTSEGHSEAESVQVCVSIEKAVSYNIKDFNSRQYREKVNKIQLKLKVSRAPPELYSPFNCLNIDRVVCIGLAWRRGQAVPN